MCDNHADCCDGEGLDKDVMPGSSLNPTITESEEQAYPGLSDAVAEAIRACTLNQFESCPVHERRKQVLNKFGDRLGWAVLRKLRW